MKPHKPDHHYSQTSKTKNFSRQSSTYGKPQQFQEQIQQLQLENNQQKSLKNEHVCYNKFNIT